MGFMNGARVHDFGLMGLGLGFTAQVVLIHVGRLGGLRVKAFRAQHVSSKTNFYLKFHTKLGVSFCK